MGLQNIAISWRRALRSLALIGCLLSLACQARGATEFRAVTLAWDANTETDLAGYKLRYGTASGSYVQTMDVGNVTHATLSNLAHGTDYYFVVSAYNTAGLEGPPSDEAVVMSDNANLSSLELSAGSLTPSFDSSVESFSTTVSNSTASLSLFAAPADSRATLTVNGVPVPPGGPSPGIGLEVGSNLVTAVVTAKNGTTRKTHTISVTRKAGLPGNFSVSNQAPVWAVTPSAGPAVRLDWTRSTNATHYDLYRNGSLAASNLTDTTRVDAAGLVTGETYTYYVVAKSSAGARNSNSIQVGPMPGPPASGPGAFTLSSAASSVGGTSRGPVVNLTWTESSGTTSYDVYRNSVLCASNLGAGQVAFVNSTNLAARQTYSYYVVARNPSGSRRSNTVVLTMPDAPKSPSRMTSPDTGSTLTSTTATFRWDAGTGVSQRTLWVGTASTGPEARDLYASSEGGYFRTVRGLPRDGKPIYVTLRSLIKGEWQSQVYAYTAFAGPKVLLLLHDSNTSPSASTPGGWDPLLAELQFPNSPIIWSGRTTSTAAPSPQGIVCYRVMFGRKDATASRKGLEGISPSSGVAPPTAFPGYYSGDFESLGDLGNEVADAISCVLTKHPLAQVALLAHGRGGLAARSFLQSPTSNTTARSAVVALQTVGTPHRGTPLARFYDYLAGHPRLNAAEADNWAVVDSLKADMSQGLDLRRPTMGDLIPSGSVISNLNSTLGSLPKIAYASQIYSGTDLGCLSRSILPFPADYSVFQQVFTETVEGIVRSKVVSPQAAAYILGAGKSPADYQGDGFVPAASQALPTQGLPQGACAGNYTYAKDVYHAEETAQTADVIFVLGQTVAWWR